MWNVLQKLAGHMECHQGFMQVCMFLQTKPQVYMQPSKVAFVVAQDMMASLTMLRALSDILSNSSMQHTPWSLSTKAPLSSTISRVSGSCRQHPTVSP